MEQEKPIAVAEPITVCIFDILGVSSHLDSNNIDEIWEFYNTFANIASSTYDSVSFDVLSITEKVHSTDHWYDSFIDIIHHAYFSDTFMFWTINHLSSIHKLVEICQDVFCRALEMQIPLRGCISSGEAIMDDEKLIYVGQPIVESARGENAQNWIGFAYGDSFRKGLHWDCKTFLPYHRHVKKEHKNAMFLSPFVVDWPRHWREHYKEDIRDVLRKMDTDSRFSSYYENALKFVRFSDAHQEWWIEAEIPSSGDYNSISEKAVAWLNSLKR
ncbi:hypothetical protein FACS1894217_02110 [Clostridia bacterium]|nr:hypothetical protein FACS1894217_02110 [Clostridia bacterium]